MYILRTTTDCDEWISVFIFPTLARRESCRGARGTENELSGLCRSFLPLPENYSTGMYCTAKARGWPRIWFSFFSFFFVSLFTRNDSTYYACRPRWQRSRCDVRFATFRNRIFPSEKPGDQPIEPARPALAVLPYYYGRLRSQKQHVSLFIFFSSYPKTINWKERVQTDGLFSKPAKERKCVHTCNELNFFFRSSRRNNWKQVAILRLKIIYKVFFHQILYCSIERFCKLKLLSW